MGAPVLVSANAFSQWKDEGPAPKGYEYSRAQWLDHVARGNTGPILHGRQRRMRSWNGWNLGPLRNAHKISELWLDSAGFSMMLLENGYPWTPEAYIFGLCARYPWSRFASLDLCVEPQIASDRIEVAERVSKTINLNYTCLKLARDAGIADRLMPVIQGANSSDYLRCFDAMEPMIGEERVIGVGSMCRRNTAGADGIVEIVTALDRRLPKGIKLHLFGLKGDGAEAVADLDDRVFSIDSQAFGVRARRIANDRRRENPEFSKTNAFVAEIMEAWYQNQVRRMGSPNPRPIQHSMDLAVGTSGRPRSNIEIAIERAHARINRLIEMGELDADQIVSHHMIEAMLSDDDEDDQGHNAPFPLAA